MTRQISAQARSILKGYETGGKGGGSLGRLVLLPRGAPALGAYIDDAGVPTIGWGHTRGVKIGQTITAAEAEALLAGDLASAETFVERTTAGAHLGTTQGQFDGMVLLAYNIGNGAFLSSTGLKRHNAGDFPGAVAAFKTWNKITQHGQKVVAGGLVERRAAEMAFYRSVA